MECMKILTNFATSRKTFIWQEYLQHHSTPQLKMGGGHE
jgi:hypothetical protein